jgi:o-succinylbenzoate synthase
MSKKIYVYRYLMHSRVGLNSRSHTTQHEGALINVEVDGVSGYACLHPWVELGDCGLDELLSQLSEGRISRQVKCALECADVDRRARQLGVSLFDGLEVPLSHATIVGGIDQVGDAVAAGFDTIKLKMGRDVTANLQLLREVYSLYPCLKIRIDFNGVSSPGALEFMLLEIGEDLRNNIDFVEDPFPLGHVAWDTLRDKYGIKFAVDREVSKADGEYDISVVKPAINNLEKVCDAAQMAGRSVVITSYMDHPVGQCYAAYCAGQMRGKYGGLINERCGLVTHGLYGSDDFTERMGAVSPSLNLDIGGNGLGFDDLLERVDWTRV